MLCSAVTRCSVLFFNPANCPIGGLLDLDSLLVFLLLSLLGARQWLAIWSLVPGSLQAASLNCVRVWSSLQVGLIWFLKTVAGYLKSARALVEEEMYTGWSLKRQHAWDAANISDRLRQVGINIEKCAHGNPYWPCKYMQVARQVASNGDVLVVDRQESGGWKGRSESLASAAVFGRPAYKTICHCALFELVPMLSRVLNRWALKGRNDCKNCESWSLKNLNMEGRCGGTIAKTYGTGSRRWLHESS